MSENSIPFLLFYKQTLMVITALPSLGVMVCLSYINLPENKPKL